MENAGNLQEANIHDPRLIVSDTSNHRFFKIFSLEELKI